MRFAVFGDGHDGLLRCLTGDYTSRFWGLRERGWAWHRTAEGKQGIDGKKRRVRRRGPNVRRLGVGGAPPGRPPRRPTNATPHRFVETTKPTRVDKTDVDNSER